MTKKKSKVQIRTKINKRYNKSKKMIGGSGNNIRRGVSGRNVVVVKMVNGQEGIIKKIIGEELMYLKKFQGDNVVKILQITDEGFPIMEKLQHIDLYNNDEKTQINNSRYGLRSYFKTLNNSDLGSLKQTVNMPDSNTFKYLLDLLNAIERVNTMGYIWGDLKTNNLGISKIDDKLYIFDFGETRLINDGNRFMDLLAYAKFLYNILIKKQFFQPGREYRVVREPIDESGYNLLIVSLITDDNRLKTELKNIFKIANKPNTKENIQMIYNSFREYLESKIDKKRN